MRCSAAYVHIPFCASKCPYCDFNSYAGISHLASRYVGALCRQIQESPQAGDGPLRTVFFGGGTPSLLPAESLVQVLEALRNRFGIAEDAEVTLEANPESADPEKLARLRQGGFNRLSIGAQDFDDDLLRALGRAHDHRRFLQAFQDARAAGFENISFDLMFALPGQTLDGLRRTLEAAIGLCPEHISAYCLTIEEGTAFHRRRAAGRLDLPDEEAQADMFLLTRSLLEDAGYEHYEISNYALPGRRCRHNEVYWRNEPYRGFGPGAVEFVEGRRVMWERDPAEFIRQVEESGRAREVFSEMLPAEKAAGESLMLALRTADGANLEELSRRFGLDVENLFQPEIERYTAAGLLNRSGCRIRLTRSGQLLADEVAAAFLR
ncbi:MAG: coproporphyrinogen III oxidase [Armatimonadota bacterium]|nr:MAG: coproporphyrinogen III oxidase [Armatimonadota bacterium]